MYIYIYPRSKVIFKKCYCMIYPQKKKKKTEFILPKQSAAPAAPAPHSAVECVAVGIPRAMRTLASQESWKRPWIWDDVHQQTMVISQKKTTIMVISERTTAGLWIMRKKNYTILQLVGTVLWSSLIIVLVKDWFVMMKQTNIKCLNLTITVFPTRLTVLRQPWDPTHWSYIILPMCTFVNKLMPAKPGRRRSAWYWLIVPAIAPTIPIFLGQFSFCESVFHFCSLETIKFSSFPFWNNHCCWNHFCFRISSFRKHSNFFW